MFQLILISDKYTMALLKDNSATNQYTLLSLLVNTAFIGNYTGPGTANSKLPGSMVNVPGILAQGSYNGQPVNLVPYFSKCDRFQSSRSSSMVHCVDSSWVDGDLFSTNSFKTGLPTSTNFLDGGGSQAIIANATSPGATGSGQFTLLTHLYRYFGVALNCSHYGNTGFPAYTARGSQYEVHKYMDLSTAQVSYFIQQVGLAAQSFGASTEDVHSVATLLNQTFGYRCSPNATVVPSEGAQLQSVCQEQSCPLSPNATCANQPPGMMPSNKASKNASRRAMNTSMASKTMIGAGESGKNRGMGGATGSATKSKPGTTFTGAAEGLAPSAFAAGLFGVAALVL